MTKFHFDVNYPFKYNQIIDNIIHVHTNRAELCKFNILELAVCLNPRMSNSNCLSNYSPHRYSEKISLSCLIHTDSLIESRKVMCS